MQWMMLLVMATRLMFDDEADHVVAAGVGDAVDDVVLIPTILMSPPMASHTPASTTYTL